MGPLPCQNCEATDWSPFWSHAEFELADFLYQEEQLSGGNISHLMSIITTLCGDKDPPFQTHKEMYDTIDAIKHGDASWQSLLVKYSGPLPEAPPAWMTSEYDVWCRNPLTLLEHQLGNLEFDGSIDYAPKVVTDIHDEREVCDLMSSQWAWDQCVSYDSHRWAANLLNKHVGKNCSERRGSWGNVCPRDSRKQQDNSVYRYRSHGVLPSLCITGQFAQQCSSCPS